MPHSSMRARSDQVHVLGIGSTPTDTDSGIRAWAAEPRFR